MDWGKLKTIFIIAFLILDIYLLTQLLNKQEVNKLEVKADVSLEENLNNDGIDYSGLPNDQVKDQYMSANTKSFSEKEVENLKDQSVTIVDDSIIYSELRHPILVEEDFDIQEIEQLVKSSVLYGEQYVFGHYDEEAGTITFYQKYKDKILFKNRSAHIVFYMDNDRKIESYEQTMLETFEPISEKEEVLPAIRAVKAVYRNRLLQPDSDIVQAELGYYTVVNMEATQVLTPTWHIVAEHNGEQESMLVNAFEGQVIEGNSEEDKTVMME
ncbi:two-component system regulatory protein YycI [Siminovitchia sediminis]|uniref:Two-component system regulatory protein YycI n=1 Tax=Siminovitchia sediminis TaxID=1274353 RepID=A0ABW4KH24_9BACI